MAELFGKKKPAVAGGGAALCTCFSSEHNLLGGFAFIGEGIPVALGAAFQSRYPQRRPGAGRCRPGHRLLLWRRHHQQRPVL